MKSCRSGESGIVNGDRSASSAGFARIQWKASRRRPWDAHTASTTARTVMGSSLFTRCTSTSTAERAT
eukprot:1464815-Pyramimonas_sp.AAC.1